MMHVVSVCKWVSTKSFKVSVESGGWTDDRGGCRRVAAGMAAHGVPHTDSQVKRASHDRRLQQTGRVRAGKENAQQNHVAKIMKKMRLYKQHDTLYTNSYSTSICPYNLDIHSIPFPLYSTSACSSASAPYCTFISPVCGLRVTVGCRLILLAVLMWPFARAIQV